MLLNESGTAYRLDAVLTVVLTLMMRRPPYLVRSLSNALVMLFGLAMIAAGQAREVVELEPYRVESPQSVADTDWVPGEAGARYRPLDLAEMLGAEVPAIGIIRKAATSNDIVYRGLSQDNVTVTIDGRKIFCACANRMDPPASQVRTAELSRVELTPGAFDLSRAGSLGAAVNLVTRAPARARRLDAAITVGSYGFFEMHGAGTGGNDRVQTYLSAAYHRGDPYEDGSGRRLTDFPDASTWPVDDYLPEFRDDRAFSGYKLATKVRTPLGDRGQLEVSGSYRDDPEVLYPGLRMDADATQTRSLGIQYMDTSHRPWADTITLDLAFTETDHDMRDTRRRSSVVNAMGMPRPRYVRERGWYMETLAQARAASLLIDIEKRVDNTALQYGVEYLRRSWDSRNRLGAGMPASGPEAEIFNAMIPDTRSTVAGTYLQGEREMNEVWSIGAGARIDHYTGEALAPVSFLASQRGSVADFEATVLSGTGYARWSPTGRTRVTFGVGHTRRPPNGQELYLQLRRPGTMPNWLGNPELEATGNTELAISMQWQGKHWQLQGRAFVSWLNDYIYPVRLDPVDLATLDKAAQSYAGIDARLYGLEISARGALKGGWSVLAGASWQRGKKDEVLPNNPDDDLAEIPPLRGRAAIVYASRHYEATLEIDASAAQDRIDPFVGEVEQPSYAIINAVMSLPLGEHETLTLGIDNMLDRTYAVHNAQVRNPFSSFTVVNEPGRFFFATFRVRR